MSEFCRWSPHLDGDTRPLCRCTAVCRSVYNFQTRSIELQIPSPTKRQGRNQRRSRKKPEKIVYRRPRLRLTQRVGVELCHVHQSALVQTPTSDSQLMYTLLRHVPGARRHVGHKLRRCPPTCHAEDLARIPAVAATTCTSQWRRDARVLGSLPLHALGSLGPLPWCRHHAGLRVPLFVAVRSLSLRDASPGSESSPPGRLSGRRPCARSAIARRQEATDQQSPKGGSQRACHTRGAHWATCCGSQNAVSSGCQPGVRVVPFLVWPVLGSPPFFLAEVTLFQRGTASDTIEPCRLEAGTKTLAVRKRSIFIERCCS